MQNTQKNFLLKHAKNWEPLSGMATQVGGGRCRLRSSRGCCLVPLRFNTRAAAIACMALQ